MASLKWGDWLKADWSTWRGRGFTGTRGGGRGGFGRSQFNGGRSRGAAGNVRDGFMSWRYNALPFQERNDDRDDTLKDTATSPIKSNGMELDGTDNNDGKAKRRLLLGGVTGGEGEGTEKVEDEGTMVMLTSDNLPLTTGVTDDNEKIRSKRSKKDGAVSPSLGSAGSFEGSVRSQ